MKATNLAINQEIVLREGDLILKAPKGDSFEKVLNRPDVGIDLLAGYGREFLAGLSLLHSVGYVHGDIKPENMLLIDGRLHISDFGQARPMEESEKTRYTANPWYLAPEGMLTKKSDVYSAGLLLIRILESRFLNPKDPSSLLISVDQEERKVSLERRGIELFVTSNAKCTQTERAGLFGNFRVLCQRLGLSITAPSRRLMDSTQKEVHRYIDALMAKLPSTHPHINELKQLLYDMTSSTPLQRPSIQEALDRYEAIFPTVPQSI